MSAREPGCLLLIDVKYELAEGKIVLSAPTQ